MHRKAMQCKAKHSGLPITVGFPVFFGHQAHWTALHGMAMQRNARHGNAKQRGQSTTVDYPGRFDLLAPGISGHLLKGNAMSIRTANVKVTGVTPLLTNNPQTVDRFNPYTRRMSEINAKKTRRTDDDYMELRELELESKSYYDDEAGVYVPASWLTEAVACNGFKVAKLSRDTIRGALFSTDDKIPLQFRDSEKVKGLKDIVKNPAFHLVMGIPQGQVRVMKAFPIYHKWSFETVLEFDDKVIDPGSLTRIVEHASRYGGFGDFRPKFGRAIAEVAHV
jgi:hypothetical protein